MTGLNDFRIDHLGIAVRSLDQPPPSSSTSTSLDFKVSAETVQSGRGKSKRRYGTSWRAAY